jgi:hypothetical protein
MFCFMSEKVEEKNFLNRLSHPRHSLQVPAKLSRLFCHYQICPISSWENGKIFNKLSFLFILNFHVFLMIVVYIFFYFFPFFSPSPSYSCFAFYAMLLFVSSIIYFYTFIFVPLRISRLWIRRLVKMRMVEKKKQPSQLSLNAEMKIIHENLILQGF